MTSKRFTEKNKPSPTTNPSGRGQYTAPVLIGLTPEQRDAVRAAAKRDQRPVVEVVPGCQLPWFASEQREKRGLK